MSVVQEEVVHKEETAVAVEEGTSIADPHHLLLCLNDLTITDGHRLLAAEETTHVVMNTEAEADMGVGEQGITRRPVVEEMVVDA